MRNTVLLFSGQIPLWIKLGVGRQLYGKAEVKSNKERAADAFTTLTQLTGQSYSSQKMPLTEEEVPADGHAI